MQKVCRNCSGPAQFSIIAIVSSIGVSGRMQKSSRAVLFCDDCLRELCVCLPSDAFCDAVNNAYTTLNDRLRERSEPQNISRG